MSELQMTVSWFRLCSTCHQRFPSDVVLETDKDWTVDKHGLYRCPKCSNENDPGRSPEG